MTVTQYEMRFSELARHAIWFVPTDMERIRRERVTSSTFEEVVDIAREIEPVCHQEREKREAKRPQESGSYGDATSRGPPQGSVVVLEEDVLTDPFDAARLLQKAFSQVGVSGHASGVSASYRSPRPENKRIRRSSAALGKNKRAWSAAPKSSPEVMVMSPPPGPIMDTVMIYDDGEASEEGVILTSRRDQLLAERHQTAVRLSKLEAKAAKAFVLEAHLKQIEQEVETLSQEIAPLRVQFEKVRAKWAKVHSVVLAASDREDASTKRLRNLEAALNSKIEELATAKVKYAQLEEKYKKIIEHNRIFSSTVCELDDSLKSTRSARENLSAEVNQLNEELKQRAASLVVEKNICYV
ncbi:uncharacterized protein [Nicotiana sylvestris]|uniref:uncharacterized protein n=1 Tax=Nicotiana sylvestris TaxID=4096 RepID=UPI00388C5F05